VRNKSRAHAAVASRLAGLIVAVILAAGLAVAFASDSCYVYEISVQGNSLVAPEEIFDRTQLEGYSVFFIDPRVAEDRIEALPDVLGATVTLSLPNHMAVLVQERQARVVWQSGENRYGVDDEGQVISLRDQPEPGIVIADVDSAAIQLGDSVDLQTVEAVERYVDLLPGVSVFEHSAQKGIGYKDERGWQVHLGDGEDAALKVAIVQALAGQLSSQGVTVEVIDVRFPESPLYRLAEGPAPEQ
jgi:cell division septal protein FtsQ